MKFRRTVAAVLVCAMLAMPLGGCAASWLVIRGAYELYEQMNGAEQAPEATEAEGPDLTKRYFSDTWRADVDFSDMAYEHYDTAYFDSLVGEIADMAGKGGEQDAFNETDNALVGELYYVYTLLNLIDLQYADDPTDGSVADERLYTEDLCDRMNGAYWSAMHALAASPNAALLSGGYQDWQIDWFRQYESGGEEELSLFSEESALEMSYDDLMAADDPDYDAIGEVYVSLVGVRNEIASLLGYDSYAEYAYWEIYARDYDPSDSAAVWEAAKTYFVPLLQNYADKVYDGTSRLYYSNEIDCSQEAILSGMAKCLPELSPELETAFTYMRDHGLYDIAPGGAKMNTGYTDKLYYYNEPFVFNCPSGTFYDYTDMFHEFGHFANMFYTQSDLLFGIGDNDLAELQSQGMEVLFLHFYDELFGADADAVRADTLLNMVYSVVDGAMYDEFQQKVYAEEKLTVERVNEIYAEVSASYGYEPYEGSETEWMNVEHTFSYPFYFISYSVSAVSALEIYALSQTSWADAVDVYLTIEALDGETLYFSEAVESAGLGGAFSGAGCERAASAAEACFEGL